VKAREEKIFKNLQDLEQRVPEISPFKGDIVRYLLFNPRMAYYTVESRARFQEGGPIRSLKAIIKIDPKEKQGYKIIQWTDSLIES